MEEIAVLKKEVEFLKKQNDEIENMLWELDIKNKEYYQMIQKQARQDIIYIMGFVLLNLAWLWWIKN